MARFTLDELSDHHEITQLMYEYATAVDTLQYDRIDNLFTPDGVIDYRAFEGPNGRWLEVKEWAEQSLREFPIRKHYITNTTVEYSPDREVASSVSYWRSPVGLERDDGTLEVFESGGRYADTLVRTPNGWRITERVVHADWVIGAPPGDRP
jgi:3-phenylpropionate/cinnamic acid dioxygenase small subunit